MPIKDIKVIDYKFQNSKITSKELKRIKKWTKQKTKGMLNKDLLQFFWDSMNN